MTSANEPVKVKESCAEDPLVKAVREHFDRKTRYCKSDKLSHIHIAANLTEDDAIFKVGDKEYQLKLDDLRLMFQAYCQDPEFSPSPGFPTKCWKLEDWKDWHKKRPKNILRRYITKTIFRVGAATTILLGLSQFVLSLPGSERQKYFQAWQVINTAQKQSGTGGRNEALEYLNKEKSFWYTPRCKDDSKNNCLVGIIIEGANLQNVNLESANLTSSEFRNTSFRDAHLKKADFTDAHLEKAYFIRAHLEGATFNKSDVKGAVFIDAHLENAIVEEKFFKEAKFCRTIMPNLTIQNRDCDALKDIEQ
jgi:Pentapeptide repeats (9 copies)